MEVHGEKLDYFRTEKKNIFLEKLRTVKIRIKPNFFESKCS